MNSHARPSPNGMITGKQSVLITGGAGFIGSNLTHELIQKGHTVHVVDNLITGHYKNIKSLKNTGKLFFHKLDITDPNFISNFSSCSLSHIYHLACPTGVPNIKTLGEEMLLTCALGTIHVLKITKQKNARLLFTSTAEIYGDPEVTPQPETYTGNVDPVGPRSAYEEGKRFAEALIVEHARKYDLNARIVRVFNTFGPRMSQKDSRVIPNFINCALNGKNLTVYGDGSQTRSHMYINDLIRGLQTVMEYGVPGETYNVGGSKQTSVIELAAKVIHLVSTISGTTNSSIQLKPHFISDHYKRQPSIKKVKKLGWQQSTSLEDGLCRLITYEMKKRNSYKSKQNTKQINKTLQRIPQIPFKNPVRIGYESFFS